MSLLPGHTVNQRPEEKFYGFGFDTSVIYTVCPGSTDPIYIVRYYIKWVTTTLTYCSVHHGYKVWSDFIFYLAMLLASWRFFLPI